MNTISISYHFCDIDKILHKTYIGKISTDDIVNSWEDALQSNLIPIEIKGIINDYSKAEFDFDIDEHEKIVALYKKHNHIFRGLKIAIVTESSKDIVIPILVQKHDLNYQSKPFATIEDK